MNLLFLGFILILHCISTTGFIFRHSPIAKFQYHNPKGQFSTFKGFDTPDDNNLREKLEDPRYLLDCLTAPDVEAENFEDLQKRDIRDKMLESIGFVQLRSLLAEQGLRTSGDKVEMLTRLLVHQIDPTVDYKESYSNAPQLHYVKAEDIASGVFQIVPEEEREALQREAANNPDAEDLQFMRSDGQNIHLPRTKVTDGLSRKVIEFPQYGIRRTDGRASTYSTEDSLPCYSVQPSHYLHAVQKVIVLISDQSGWKTKINRVVADEICFRSSSLVLVPDLYRSQAISSDATTAEVKAWSNTVDREQVFDDLISTLLFVRSMVPKASIALVGIGYGGGLALEATTDLYDMASWTEGQKLLTVEGIEDEDWSIEVEDKITSIHKSFNIFRRAKCDKKYYERLIGINSQPEEDSPIVTKESLAQEASDMLEQVMAGLKQENEEKAAEEQRQRDIEAGLINEDDREEEEAMGPEILFSKEQLKAIESNDREVTFEDTNTTTEVIWPELNQIRNNQISANDIDDYDLWKSQNEGSVMFRPRPQPTHGEVVSRLRSEIDIVRHKHKNIETRLNINSATSQVTSQQICEIIPMSVTVIQPTHYDVDKIGGRMLAPTLFIDTSVASGVASLFKQFDERKEEILDYYFNLFQTSKTFFVHPTTDDDIVCRMFIFDIIMMWLESFKYTNDKEFTITAGTTKRSDRALLTHSLEDVKRFNYQIDQQIVTDFVHDEEGYIEVELKGKNN